MNRIRQIRLFFENNLPEGEMDEFLGWTQGPEGKKALKSQINDLWDQGESDPQEAWNVNEEFAKMLAQKEFVFQSSNNKKVEESFPWGKWIRYSAAVILFLVLAIPLSRMYLSSEKEAPVTEIEEEYITRSNPAGQKSKITLPDGSSVYLNASSSIQFAENFRSNRNLILEGEAFFEVKEDPQHPFKVTAGGTVTEALGTSFNIREFDTRVGTEVTLVTGIVAVEVVKNKSSVKLRPGEAAQYLDESGELNSYKVDPEKMIEWIHGILRLENQKIQSVVLKLENWYGVKIQLKGNLPSDKISGIFSPGESLENVLMSISHTVPFRYEIVEKQVTLTFDQN